MIESKIIKNQTSTSEPKEKIRSYGVKIPINVVEKDGIYMYDIMEFNSLQEYNQWQIEQKDNEIQELKNKISELEVEPPLVDRTETNSNNIENHESLLNDLSQMIVEISTLQQI